MKAAPRPFCIGWPALLPPFQSGIAFGAVPVLEPAPADCAPPLGHAPLKGRDPPD